MLGDLVAGFRDHERAAVAEVADGAHLVVLGHERGRLSHERVGLTDEIVEQVCHVERDALRLLLLVLVGRDDLVQRVFKHLKRRDVKIDPEDGGDLSLPVADVDGGGFQDLAVRRPRQIADLILGVRVLLTELLEHDVRRPVAGLSSAHMAVFDGHDGAVCAALGQLVDHDLAA